MELTADDVRDVLASFFRRSEMIQAAGGIALKDVVDGTATVPDGWRLDDATYFYVPPNLDLTTLDSVQ